MPVSVLGNDAHVKADGMFLCQILLALSVLPFVYVNYWLALVSAVPAYVLLAKIAAKSLDRRSEKARQQHAARQKMRAIR